MDFLRRKNGFLEREKTISGENINFMREKNRYSEKIAFHEKVLDLPRKKWISREINMDFPKERKNKFLKKEKNEFLKKEKIDFRKKIKMDFLKKWISQATKWIFSPKNCIISNNFDKF